MTNIYLLHSEGSTRFCSRQPEGVADPASINAWLNIFTVMSLAPDGFEMKVAFLTGEGFPANATLVKGPNQMKISDSEGLSLYLYAKEIRVEYLPPIPMPL